MRRRSREREGGGDGGDALSYLNIILNEFLNHLRREGGELPSIDEGLNEIDKELIARELFKEGEETREENVGALQKERMRRDKKKEKAMIAWR